MQPDLQFDAPPIQPEQSSPATAVVPFEFEGAAVRTLDRLGDAWFVLADACRVLELDNPSYVAARLDDDERDTLVIDYPQGGPRSTIIISEPGLYKLIGTSRKPAAKRFDRWVRHEVLPSIRKTGSYTAPGAQPATQQIDMAALATTVASAMQKCLKCMENYFAPRWRKPLPAAVLAPNTG